MRVVSRISEYQETSKAAIQRQFGKPTIEEPEDLGKDYGIAALIVSILALLVFVQVPLLNIAFAIVAILLAKKAMIKRGAGERLGPHCKDSGSDSSWSWNILHHIYRNHCCLCHCRGHLISSSKYWRQQSPLYPGFE